MILNKMIARCKKAKMINFCIDKNDNKWLSNGKTFMRLKNNSNLKSEDIFEYLGTDEDEKTKYICIDEEIMNYEIINEEIEMLPVIINDCAVFKTTQGIALSDYTEIKDLKIKTISDFKLSKVFDTYAICVDNAGFTLLDKIDTKKFEDLCSELYGLAKKSNETGFLDAGGQMEMEV